MGDQVKYNQQIIGVKSTDREHSLRIVKICLKRALMDYEANVQKTTFDKFFDVYDHISEVLGEGFSEPTLRKWININTTHFCQPQQLIVLCNYIKNRKPIDALIEYMDAMT
jgi:hypothetical protein